MHKFAVATIAFVLSVASTSAFAQGKCKSPIGKYAGASHHNGAKMEILPGGQAIYDRGGPRETHLTWSDFMGKKDTCPQARIVFPDPRLQPMCYPSLRRNCGVD